MVPSPRRLPLLFLDVDGPLIPFGATSYPSYGDDLAPDARPFAWVDDEITGTDRAWVAAHHRGPALLHRVDPRRGLTDADYLALADWLQRA
jgi:hypothetical protein